MEALRADTAEAIKNLRAATHTAIHTGTKTVEDLSNLFGMKCTNLHERLVGKYDHSFMAKICETDNDIHELSSGNMTLSAKAEETNGRTNTSNEAAREAGSAAYEKILDCITAAVRSTGKIGISQFYVTSKLDMWIDTKARSEKADTSWYRWPSHCALQTLVQRGKIVNPPGSSRYFAPEFAPTRTHRAAKSAYRDEPGFIYAIDPRAIDADTGHRIYKLGMTHETEQKVKAMYKRYCTVWPKALLLRLYSVPNCREAEPLVFDMLNMYRQSPKHEIFEKGITTDEIFMVFEAVQSEVGGEPISIADVSTVQN